ncbi:MAG: CHAT domain-containing protein, partial [Pirellulaceae bacterium]
IEACDIFKKTLGAEHPRYASSLDYLGTMYETMGAYAQAEPLLRDAVEIRLASARNILPTLSEARAFQYVKKLGGPDALLSTLRHLDNQDHRRTYDTVWQTRGLVTQTLAQRRSTLIDNPEAQGTLDQLRSAQQQLAQWTLMVPTPDQRQRRQQRLAELNDKKERLETQLAKLSSQFRRSLELNEVDVAGLARVLPDQTALVDILKVTVWTRPKEGKGALNSEQHYEAFVVRRIDAEPGYSVQWVHLGSAIPIEDAVVNWRKAIVKQTDQAVGPDDHQQGTLRALVWEKIEPHLGNCKHIVIVPDAALTRIPWAALPGQKPDSFLIEEYSISTIDNGKQLYAKLTEPKITGKTMLLVGGVQYDQATEQKEPPTIASTAGSDGGSNSRGPALSDEQPKWGFLAGSSKEVDILAKLEGGSFELSSTVLKGAFADENAMRRDMPRSRYVHLATHGFFANEKFRSLFGHDMRNEQLFAGDQDLVTAGLSGVTVRNPLLLSGLVLAGANLPPETDQLGILTGQDGILTAEEVVNLDLRKTELVVLSACETGLGKVAGGEGVMGLQRAFGLAGARACVASLWKVDDNATQTLMVIFYRNLFEKKMSKVDALREAQLWMLNTPGAAQSSIVRGQVVRLKKPAVDAPSRNGKRTHPRYWAAFMLSGDWR